MTDRQKADLIIKRMRDHGYDVEDNCNHMNDEDIDWVLANYEDHYITNYKEPKKKDDKMESKKKEDPKDPSADSMTAPSVNHQPLNFLPGVFWWGGHFPNLYQQSNAGKPKKEKVEGVSKSSAFIQLIEMQFKFCKKCAQMSPHKDDKCQVCGK